MKHKLTVVICLALMFAAGAYSVVSYQHYRAWAVAQHQKAVDSQKAQADASLQQNIRFNRNLDKLKAQCSTDHQKYLALTPVQRNAKGAVSDCDPALIQLAQ